MISGFWGVVALTILLVIGGGYGVFEIILDRRRSPRGGGVWLLCIFLLDAGVTLIALLFLDSVIVRTVWSSPILIYLTALIWSPFLLRTQFDFLVPGGPRAREVLHLLPTVRQFLYRRFSMGIAGYTANWLSKVVIPTVRAHGLASLTSRADDYFANLSGIPEIDQEKLISQIRSISGDTDSNLDQRIRAVAQVLIENDGRPLLASFLREQVPKP